jgi:hypothetical protein
MCTPKPLITDIADALRRMDRSWGIDLGSKAFAGIVSEIHDVVVDHFEANDHVVLDDPASDFLRDAAARYNEAVSAPAVPAYDTLELPLRREALDRARNDHEDAHDVVDAAVLYLAFLKTGLEQDSVQGDFFQEQDYVVTDLEAYDDGYKLGQMFADRVAEEGRPPVNVHPDSQRDFEVGISHGVAAGSTL